MRAALSAVWAIIFSGGIIQMANGLQTELLGVRAGEEAFSPWSIGVLMAGYYVGYSAAPLLIRTIIRRLGHVRTIAIGLTLAAAMIVLHGLFVNPIAWTLLRVVSGFALASNYVAGESWINARSENRVRGRIFSVYIVVQMIGMTAAQFLFAAGDPKSLSLFVLAGALFLLSTVPVIFFAKNAPGAAPPEPFGLVHLFRVSPLGAVATVMAGTAWSILFTFGPVYARAEHFTVPQVSVFMGAALVAGGILQFPFGWVSDAIGRRITIMLMCAAGVAASLFGVWAEGRGIVFLYAASALVGGFLFPLYALAVAHTNDAVAPTTRVAATAGLVLLFGLGSIVGPLAAGWAMTFLGPISFFGLLAAVLAATVAAAVTSR
jgi:MFS family permease